MQKSEVAKARGKKGKSSRKQPTQTPIDHRPYSGAREGRQPLPDQQHSSPEAFAPDRQRDASRE